MSIVNEIFNTPGVDIESYYTGGTWNTWNKPRGSKWTYIYSSGAGCGGGCGVNTSTTSGGGGSGAGGASSTLLVPSRYLPDTLYIFPGIGGAGATTSGGVGSVGTDTAIAFEPVSTKNVSFIISAGSPGGGTSATTTTGGGGGGGGTVSTISTAIFLGVFGRFTWLGGDNGVPGGNSGTAGVDGGSIVDTHLACAAAGGGGCNGATATAGGGFAFSIGLGRGFWPSAISGGAAASGATPAGNGSDGITWPFINGGLPWGWPMGGCGGGGSTTTLGGTAGSGGNGAPGSGGGGGGGCNTTNATIPVGGRGGDGYVILVTMF